MPTRVWTVKMLERLLVLDGKPARLARTPGPWRDEALRALSRLFPDRDASEAALLDLDRSAHGRRRRRRWTAAELTTLRKVDPTTETKEIAEQLERSVCSVYAQAALMGIRKTPEFKAAMLRRLGKRLQVTGTGTRFQKGHVPWSKGRKGLDLGGRSRETRFKKGNRPHTWVPVGTESTSDGYRVRKVRDTGRGQWVDWKFVHHQLWENAHGRKVPRGHALVFKNGDRTDVRLENLELISRRELMRRNTIHNYPESVKGAIRALARLRKTIRKESRDGQEPN